MAQAPTELMWVRLLLANLHITMPKTMELRYDNRTTTYIANNPMFHERKKHVEMDCQYTCHLIQCSLLHTVSVSSKDQTKPLPHPLFDWCYNKLSKMGMHAPA